MSQGGMWWTTSFLVLLTLFLPQWLSADPQNSHAGDTSDQSLLWGPYRPNLYFGVRPRVPKSLMAGLLWSRVDNFAQVQNSMSASASARVVPLLTSSRLQAYV